VILPGASWGETPTSPGTWRDQFGVPVLTDQYKQPLKGKVTILEKQGVQADEFHAPVPHLKLRVDIEGTPLYDILVPIDSIRGNRDTFVTTMETLVLPQGTRCSKELRDCMYASSLAPEYWKVHEKEFISTADGLVANGVALTNFLVTIVAESVNSENGEKTYTLREEKTGKRVVVAAEEIPLGQWGWRFGGRVFDPIQTWFELSREWRNRTDDERQEFALQPLREQEDAIRKEHDSIRAQFDAQDKAARWRIS
jgi:hypothetical protein